MPSPLIWGPCPPAALGHPTTRTDPRCVEVVVPLITVCHVAFVLQISDSDVPLPETDEFSEEFVDFVSMCMEKDPDDRPSAEALLASRWIQRHKSSANSELKAFVRTLYPDADQRIQRDQQAAMEFSLMQ
eukprot:1187636-Prorocentrum_minimum.AAC.1